LRARIAAKHREALQAEKEDVHALVERFSGLASGPVWREGERVVAEGKGKDVLRRSFVDPDQAAKDLSQKRTAISSTSTSLPASPLEASLQQLEAPKQSLPKTYGPRIAVVGDRLFTDTLLANRLRALLPSQGTRDNIISIQIGAGTQLPIKRL
jgi:phosphatidylglycerophosphatase GEP4